MLDLMVRVHIAIPGTEVKVLGVLHRFGNSARVIYVVEGEHIHGNVKTIYPVLDMNQ